MKPPLLVDQQKSPFTTTLPLHPGSQGYDTRQDYLIKGHLPSLRPQRLVQVLPGGVLGLPYRHRHALGGTAGHAGLGAVYCRRRRYRRTAAH